MVFLSFLVAMAITMTLSQVQAVEDLDVYYPQVQVYVDKSCFEAWKSTTGLSDMNKFMAEINALFVNTNDFYKSLSKYSNIRVEFGIQNITMLDTNVIPNEGYNRVDSIRAIHYFRQWMQPQFQSNPYDIAIIFTGYNMNPVLGRAMIGKVCTDLGVAILTFTGLSTQIEILAHEFGHSLGAQHDTDDYKDQSCYKYGRTVMTPAANPWYTTRFKFSYCSYTYFKNMFKTLDNQDKNCLRDNAENVAKGVLFGSLMTADDVCNRITDGTFLNRARYTRYPHDVCNMLRCKGKTREAVASTPQGLRCGKNKVCRVGACVEDPLGSPLTVDTCPFGDQPKIGSNYDKTCGEIQPSECDTYKKECCLSCNSTNPLYEMTADEACKLLDGPNSVFIRGYYKTYGDDLCTNIVCSSNKSGEKFIFNKFPAPEGFACGKNKRCVSGKCTATNHGNPKVTSDSCPFGDQDTKGLNYSKTCAQYAETQCSRWGTTCCQSCQGK